MSTDIQKRRIIVYPIVAGPDYRGNADDDQVPFDAVPLTAEYLRARGASPLRSGETWEIRLALKYTDEDGALAAVSLATASNIVLHVWHQSTGAWVGSRTQDAVIGVTALVELEVDTPSTAGTITIIWHQDETLTSGVHSFAILADWTYTEAVAAGTIEILDARPTS